MGTRVRIWLLLLGAALPVVAQNQWNFPWWNSPVVEQIGLSQAQTQKMHQIVRAYRDRLLDARNTARKAQEEFEDVLSDPDVSPEAAKPAIERLSTAVGNASRVFLEMNIQMRAVLTLDQWRQLIRRWDEVQRKRPSETQMPPD